MQLIPINFHQSRKKKIVPAYGRSGVSMVTSYRTDRVAVAIADWLVRLTACWKGVRRRDRVLVRPTSKIINYLLISLIVVVLGRVYSSYDIKAPPKNPFAYKTVDSSICWETIKTRTTDRSCRLSEKSFCGFREPIIYRYV